MACHRHAELNMKISGTGVAAAVSIILKERRYDILLRVHL